MGVRENKVEKYLDDEITKIGGLTRKWVCPGRDGVPDRIVIYKNKVYFVEIKTVDGVLSSAQEREHDRLKKAGVAVVTVWGEYGVDRWVEKLRLR